jgi:hypothetical protein
MVSLDTTLQKGKSDLMAADAASALLPLPTGPSRMTDSSGVLSLFRTCRVQAAAENV